MCVGSRKRGGLNYGDESERGWTGLSESVKDAGCEAGGGPLRCECRRRNETEILVFVLDLKFDPVVYTCWRRRRKIAGKSRSCYSGERKSLVLRRRTREDE